jgi:hypothetical protein
MKIVPAKDTIATLKKQALECESSAQTAEGPEKSELQELAEQCKEWADSLRKGT